MDSFYDAPRCAPPPTEFKNFLAIPVVPEVSIICQSKTPQSHFTTYNNWVAHQKVPDKVLTPNNENILRSPHNFQQSIQYSNQQDTSQLMKKQVRFESPVLQQRPLMTNQKFVLKNGNQCLNETKLANEQKVSPCWGGNNFEQIYMANIPKRELDLSVIDLPKHVKTSQEIPISVHEKEDLNSTIANKENVETPKKVLPKTYREFLDAQKLNVKNNKPSLNDSVTDIFNYKKNKPVTKYTENPHIKNNQESPKVSHPTQIVLPPIVNNQYQCRRLEGNTVHTTIRPCNTFEHRQYQRDKRQPLDSPKCDGGTQTSIFSEDLSLNKIPENVQIQNKNDEPSNKDLLKIIAQQNEQLLLLQKQVAMLLNRDQNQAKSIEAPTTHYLSEKLISSTQNDNFRLDGTPKKKGMSKFSIDLMTSFEVAIRPQHKQNFINMEPKIQEITESESLASGLDNKDEKAIEQSLCLPNPVREMCPSPEPSININMQDYDSSDEEVTASEIGATFYQNLMGQVNNILKKAHLQTREDLAARDEIKVKAPPKNAKERQLNKVKEATLKHLKSIGVTVDSTDESDESTSSANSRDYSPSEISFAIKQMLMKYLPDEQLVKLANNTDKPRNMKGKPGAIPSRPEFSFASVQYMKKYNLLPPSETKQNDMHMSKPNRQNEDNLNNPKILDLTALKMQPKLL